MIALWERSDPLRGSSLNIRTPRLVHWNSEVIKVASRGNISRLQALFSEGLASPFDVGDETSEGLLFVSNYPEKFHSDLANSWQVLKI